MVVGRGIAGLLDRGVLGDGVWTGIAFGSDVRAHMEPDGHKRLAYRDGSIGDAVVAVNTGAESGPQGRGAQGGHVGVGPLTIHREARDVGVPGVVLREDRTTVDRRAAGVRIRDGRRTST